MMRRGGRFRAALRQNKHVNDIISQNRARVKHEGDHTLFAYSEEAHSSQTDAYQIASLGTGPSQPTDQNRKSKIKPPSGLRGKELGLWFRDRNREKQAKERESRKKNDLIYPVKLDATVASEICSVLDRQKIDLVQAVSSCGSKNQNDSDARVRYRHIKESDFKRRYLNNITGSIEENICKSLSTNVVLKRDPQLDDAYHSELISKQQSKKYNSMLEFRKKLPAYQMRHQLIELIRSNQIVVISGETGCGKTTQVGQFILDDCIESGNGSVTHIVCTQPRRISAITVADRVADERAESVGTGSVGYQIRLEAKKPRSRGSILFCTTGILTQFLESDPALKHISHLVLDEIHERDTISDFAITILKDVIPKRQDLKLILMSATLNAENFSTYFNHCPIITIPGFTYPVREYYLEDILQMTGISMTFKKKSRREIEIADLIRSTCSNKYSPFVMRQILDPQSEELNIDLIFDVLQYICNNEKTEGAVLVFLPGIVQITALHRMLTDSEQFPSSRAQIHVLHSMIPTHTQKAAFQKPPKFVRKIILATNIAETSITIDDVVFVIDAGKIKMSNFDVEKNIATLKAEWVSQANAHQRRGRAGRVQEGVCYHLFTRARSMTLDQYPLPEMLRTRLEEVILSAKLLQVGDVATFLKKVMNPPNSRAVELSVELLEKLGALDSYENLTPLGFHLAKLPMDPQTGKMILMGAIFCCIDPIFTIAASLSFKDAFYTPIGKEKMVDEKKMELAKGMKSDHLLLAEAMRGWEDAEKRGRGWQFCNEFFLSRPILVQLKEMKAQFAEHLSQIGFLDCNDMKASAANINSNNYALIRSIICAGLYPNVAILRDLKPMKSGHCLQFIRTPEQENVKHHPKSVNEKQSEFESRFLVYHQKIQSTAIFLHDTSMVYPLSLLFFGGGFEFKSDGEGGTVIEINDELKFHCDNKTADLIKELKLRLDMLLEYKSSHPGVTDWTQNSNEGAILRAITCLLTSEDQFVLRKLASS
ncbi:unnamed protein product [Bemisia tabaci]|uniref:RNA helicase n=1 Tax=Bemisia tabaci TaxID=7038 RepID=A0A9N9ZZB1_BEMTA|nr:unnamed protein product [Bemisia tabaci]